MGDFFKTLLLGLLYVVLSPFIALLLVLYFVYCLIIFIYMSIRNLIVFFSGGTVNGDLKEDIKAKRILQERQEQKLDLASQTTNTTTNNQSSYTMNNSTIILAHPDMINNLQNQNVINNQTNNDQIPLDIKEIESNQNNNVSSADQVENKESEDNKL